jgi:hypothetical protein
MTLPNDIVVRVGAVVVGVLLTRAATAALRGEPIALVGRGEGSTTFRGWGARVAGVILIVVAFGFFALAWVGVGSP